MVHNVAKEGQYMLSHPLGQELLNRQRLHRLTPTIAIGTQCEAARHKLSRFPQKVQRKRFRISDPHRLSQHSQPNPLTVIILSSNRDVSVRSSTEKHKKPPCIALHKDPCVARCMFINRAVHVSPQWLSLVARSNTYRPATHVLRRNEHVACS